ncbi:30S ribosomal protein S15 [Roseiflexus sp. AH-315-K22]|nr:30S ribosomal protein S15 [Roseiflexus sp. AH-315-K22]
MTMVAERKAQIIKDFQVNDTDSGSPQVQIALLTERIKELSGHLKDHKHDFHSRRGLLQMVSRRNKLLSYLSRIDRDAYLDVIARLGLRK